MDFDLIYSPLHHTFLMIYLTPHADNTFYYRWLMAPAPIISPHYADWSFSSSNSSSSSPDGSHNDDDDDDIVQQILHHPWSPEAVLLHAPAPPAGNYIYAGSVHAGYFGDGVDVTRGGAKMLLSWTHRTGVDAAEVGGGYALVTAEVELELDFAGGL
jgi:hypothetical protein